MSRVYGELSIWTARDRTYMHAPLYKQVFIPPPLQNQKLEPKYRATSTEDITATDIEDNNQGLRILDLVTDIGE